MSHFKTYFDAYYMIFVILLVLGTTYWIISSTSESCGLDKFAKEIESKKKYDTCVNVLKEPEITCKKLYYPKVFNEDQRILELVKKDLKESR